MVSILKKKMVASYYDGWTWALGSGDELQGAIANPAAADTYFM